MQHLLKRKKRRVSIAPEFPDACRSRGRTNAEENGGREVYEAENGELGRFLKSRLSPCEIDDTHRARPGLPSTFTTQY